MREPDEDGHGEFGSHRVRREVAKKKSKRLNTYGSFPSICPFFSLQLWICTNQIGCKQYVNKIKIKEEKNAWTFMYKHFFKDRFCADKI